MRAAPIRWIRAGWGTARVEYRVRDEPRRQTAHITSDSRASDRLCLIERENAFHVALQGLRTLQELIAHLVGTPRGHDRLRGARDLHSLAADLRVVSTPNRGDLRIGRGVIAFNLRIGGVLS